MFGAIALPTVPNGSLVCDPPLSHPTSRRCAAVARTCVEGDGSLRSGAVDSIYERFEQSQSVRGQPHARANHHAVVAVSGQMAFEGRYCGVIGVDVADVREPTTFRHVAQRERDSVINLLRGHPWWQSRIQKIHGPRIEADQNYPFHAFSPVTLAGQAPAARLRSSCRVYGRSRASLSFPVAYRGRHRSRRVPPESRRAPLPPE